MSTLATLSLEDIRYAVKLATHVAAYSFDSDFLPWRPDYSANVTETGVTAIFDYRDLDWPSSPNPDLQSLIMQIKAISKRYPTPVLKSVRARATVDAGLEGSTFSVYDFFQTRPPAEDIFLPLLVDPKSSQGRLTLIRTKLRPRTGQENVVFDMTTSLYLDPTDLPNPHVPD